MTRARLGPLGLTFLLLGDAVAAAEEMAPIPAGEMWMGRAKNWLLDELGMHLRPRLDDQPVHVVYVDAFWMDRDEVTNAAYARFAKATGRPRPFHWRHGEIPPGQDRFPVTNITWDDAAAYCKFVGKRLPTEAEWERAARGGDDKSMSMLMFPWGDRLDSGSARYGRPDGPTTVGSYAPNAFGLHDVVGNVWEWVADWYDAGYYVVSPERNPPGPKAGLYRVIRGGGWSDYDERNLALHYRNFSNPTLPSSTVGCRCARSRPPGAKP